MKNIINLSKKNIIIPFSSGIVILLIIANIGYLFLKSISSKSQQVKKNVETITKINTKVSQKKCKKY